MDYKNFFIRSIISILFIAIYILILSINFYYIFYLILFIYLFVFFEIYFYFKKYRLIPLIYVLISFIFFCLIEFNYENYINFNLFVFTVVLFDSFSYVSGKIFGKNKLIAISPNKTIEGLFGGILISFFLSLVLVHFFNSALSLKIILTIALIIIFAFFGDIIESYFKRKNNLKNSSELIPGHGGIFDRFDSFLFSIIFYSISNIIL